MNKNDFTPEEIQILRKNPNVLGVSDSRITYTRAFKVHLVNEYRKGKTPTQIFREAGFNTRILGSKRIERAAANWKKTYAKNVLCLEMGKDFMPEGIRIGRDEENQLLIAKLRKEIEALKEQVSTLSAMLEIERGSECSKHA